jgi:hypothetical protein
VLHFILDFLLKFFYGVKIEESIWSADLVALVAMVLNFRGSTIIGNFFGCIVFPVEMDQVGYSALLFMDYGILEIGSFLLCGFECLEIQC